MSLGDDIAAQESECIDLDPEPENSIPGLDDAALEAAHSAYVTYLWSGKWDGPETRREAMRRAITTYLQSCGLPQKLAEAEAERDELAREEARWEYRAKHYHDRWNVEKVAAFAAREDNERLRAAGEAVRDCEHHAACGYCHGALYDALATTPPPSEPKEGEE